MSEQYSDNEKQKNTPTGHHYSWFQVWSVVLARPATDTFERVLADPAANSNRAVRWVFVSSFVLVLISLVTVLRQLNVPFNFNYILSALFSAILMTVVFVLVTVFMHGCARLAGGRGSIEHFQYAFAAFYIPLLFIQYMVAQIAPQSAIFLTALGLYRLLLLGMALRAVYKFTWGKAILALALMVLVMIGVVFGIALLVLIFANSISGVPAF
ncbi:MAG: YIP1 family protein [Aggregatilineales bacterium]